MVLTGISSILPLPPPRCSNSIFKIFRDATQRNATQGQHVFAQSSSGQLPSPIRPSIGRLPIQFPMSVSADFPQRCMGDQHMFAHRSNSDLESPTRPKCLYQKVFLQVHGHGGPTHVCTQKQFRSRISRPSAPEDFPTYTVASPAQSISNV